MKDWGQEEKGMTEDEMAGWHLIKGGTKSWTRLSGQEEKGTREDEMAGWHH